MSQFHFQPFMVKIHETSLDLMTWSVAFGFYYLMSAIIIIQNMNKRKDIVECFKFIGKSRQDGPLDFPFFKNMFYFQFFWMFIVSILFAIACGVIVKDYTGKSYVVFFIGWFLFLTLVFYPLLLLKALFGSLAGNLGVWAMFLKNQAEGMKKSLKDETLEYILFPLI